MSDYPQLARLIEIVRRLRAPDGCPWDRAQTHDSIKRNLVEECGEFLDALEDNDLEEVREELGDLLLQVILHAQIGVEAGEFDIEEIAKEEADKLVRRHPHVFGTVHAENAEAALAAWEGSKRGEAGAQSRRKSLMDGVPRNMPGLSRAQKMLGKAAKVGFEWPSLDGALSKVDEELAELKAAIAEGDQSHIQEELGDVLCTLVNVGRCHKIEAEEAMHASVLKFIRRFRYIEEHAGKPLEECSLDEMQNLWRDAKSNQA